jgi:lysophospholipase L1-like esterase
MRPVSFARAPRPGRPRVLCFGGSATLGLPYLDRPQLAFPARLAHHLRRAGVEAEVINLGAASFSSDHVLELVTATAGAGAAALVVYTANNEFLVYHEHLADLNRGRVFARVGRLHVITALRRALGLEGATPAAVVSRAEHQRGPQWQRTLAQRALVRGMIKDAIQRGGAAARPAPGPAGHLERRDRHHRVVMERYRANLAAVAAVARGASPRPLLVLVEVPTNLYHEPILSMHDPALGEADARAHRQALRRGRRRMARGEYAAAARAFAGAVAIDPLHAGGYYGRGRARLRLGQRAAAVRDLQAAVELDASPGRPVAAQGRIVRDLAARDRGVLHVDLEPALGLRADPRRAAELFADACHLTVEGYDRIGRALAEALAPRLRGAAGAATGGGAHPAPASD